MDTAARYRSLFPSLERQTYLNSCAHGAQSVRARAAANAFLDSWEAGADWAAWTALVDEARREFARFIGADVEEVALTANASSAISSIASALGFPHDRRTVLTTDLDFPTAPYIWREQEPRGARIEHLKAEGGVLRPDTLARHVTPGTRVVSIPHVASFNGFRLDVKAMADAAHAQGALVMVDGFQAAGTMPIDVHALDVDFYVTGVYKWLLGTAGVAFLYVRKDLHAALRPTVGGWLAQEVPYNFDPFAPPAPDARRYQYGGTSIIGARIAMEGLRLLTEVGLRNVEAHNRGLCNHLLDACDARGFEVLSSRESGDRSSIVTFRVPRLQETLAALQSAGVVVNSRLNGIRVSPHFYNTPAEVERLFEVIDKVHA